MNADQLLLAVASGALMIGIGLTWSGLRRVHRDSAVVAATPVEVRPLAAGALIGGLMFAVSGWIVPAAVSALGVALVMIRLSSPGRSHDTPEQIDALASWVENVRDVLQAAGQPIGAIGATVESAADGIRPTIRRLFARLSAGQPADWALRAFADELDDPLGDLVAAGLLIAVSRGGQTEQVLSALADQARAQADRRRIVEAERAPMRHQVLMVSVIMGALLAGVFVFARSDYLAPYRAAEGQVVLGAILLGYVGLLARVATLSRFPRPGRFLTVGADR